MIGLLVVVSHREVADTQGADGVFQRAGGDVGLDVSGKDGIAPLVAQMEGLGDEVVDGAREVDTLLLTFGGGHQFTFDGGLDIGIVDLQQTAVTLW